MQVPFTRNQIVELRNSSSLCHYDERGLVQECTAIKIAGRKAFSLTVLIAGEEFELEAFIEEKLKWYDVNDGNTAIEIVAVERSMRLKKCVKEEIDYKMSIIAEEPDMKESANDAEKIMMKLKDGRSTDLSLFTWAQRDLIADELENAHDIALDNVGYGSKSQDKYYRHLARQYFEVVEFVREQADKI